MTLFQLRKTIEAKIGKNLPATQVAQAIGVSKQQYWAYEQGLHKPSIIIARNMTRYFQQWMPELTLERMADILEETKPENELAAVR